MDHKDRAAGPISETHTDRAGRFRLESLPAELKEVGAVKRGYLDCRGTDPPAEPEELQLVLEEAGQIRGEVVEAEGGAPVRNFTVKVSRGRRAQSDGKARTGLPASLVRDGVQIGSAEGRFTLRQLAAGDLFDLTVVAGERVDATVRDAEARPLSEEVEPLRIELARGEEVRGRVVSAVDGEPVPGTKVTHFNDTGVGGGGSILWDRNRLRETLREATTDANGEFRLSGLSPSPGTLLLEKRGMARTAIVPLVPSKDPLEIRLALGAVLEGTVQEASGEPVAGARVGVRFGDLVLPGRLTAADGRYSIDDLPAGEASVEVSAFGRVSRRGTVQLREGERSVLDFSGSRGSIAGRVTSGGKPLAGAEVSLAGKQRDLGGARAVADAEGVFRFENLAPGRYQIEAERAGVRRAFLAGARQVVEVTVGEARCDLAIAAGALAGRVIDRSTGRPVAGAEVQLQTYGPESARDLPVLSVFGLWAWVESRKLPAAESRYRFEDLPPGRYLLIASRGPGEPAAGWLGPVDLDPGRPPEEMTLAVGG
ncbi:MAG: MSCRAMM family protein, partial [Thermoanaerobaculia bacterium]